MSLHDSETSSLVSRLPTEVLCHIFIYTLPEIACTLLQLNSPPILLTRVCRRWREVSVDMPSLWCKLSMRSYWKDLQRRRRLFCYDYGSWLKRTRGYPLSLEVSMCLEQESITLRTLLQPYIYQISSFKVTLYRPVALDTLLNNLPALQELRIDTISIPCIGDLKYYTLQYMSPIISRLSTLRTLKLEGIRCVASDHLLLFNPVWAHLSNLTIDRCQQHIVKCLLIQSPNLSSLRILEVFECDFHIEPLTHTAIQSLSITSRSSGESESVASVLNALTLPNLRLPDVGGKFWTGEELKDVGSGTVGWAIGL
ncbi:hypothetical protein BDR03DRAFT_972476 [Suillus americanus]|nr:hypothetical protein BDR03DRAFT_972476 [Suillus americanus]